MEKMKLSGKKVDSRSKEFNEVKKELSTLNWALKSRDELWDGRFGELLKEALTIKSSLASLSSRIWSLERDSEKNFEKTILKLTDLGVGLNKIKG